MDMSGHDKLDGCQVNGGAAFAGECAQLRYLSGNNLVGVPASMKLPLPSLQRRYGAAYGAVVVAATVVRCTIAATSSSTDMTCESLTRASMRMRPHAAGLSKAYFRM